MATGDQADIQKRLLATLPRRWFGSVHPKIDALLQGPAAVLAFAYSLYAYAALQLRLATATDGWLDMWAGDFFGPRRLRRRAGQTDATYRFLLQQSILRKKNTRPALEDVIQDFTGYPAAYIEEARRIWDGNAWNAFGGYNVGRPYGTALEPLSVFITVYRPDPAGPLSAITDADIFAVIDAVKPASYAYWVKIIDHP